MEATSMLPQGETARQYDTGTRVSRQASASKLFCTEMVGRVADRAVEINGGAGYMAEYCVEGIAKLNHRN
jgi:acyl-CoA dehydrogenase